MYKNDQIEGNYFKLCRAVKPQGIEFLLIQLQFCPNVLQWDVLFCILEKQNKTKQNLD